MKYLRAALAVCLVVFVAAPIAPPRHVVWTTDLQKMKAPPGPVAGKLFGTDQKADQFQLQPSGALSMRLARGGMIFIFLPVKTVQDLEGASYEFGADKIIGENRPAVHVHVHHPITKAEAWSEGYALRLNFGKQKDKRLSGSIYLCLPEEEKGFIAGTFTLDVPAK